MENMDNFSPQNKSNILELPTDNIVTPPTTTTEKNNKYINLLNLFIFIYLLIPLLSVEGLVGWGLGVLGICKTIKIYRSNYENKNKKALKLLIIFITAAVAYNTAVYYITKIIVAKVI